MGTTTRNKRITKEINPVIPKMVFSIPVPSKRAVVKVKEKEGSFRIFVVDAGGKWSREEISRITFSVGKEIKGVAAGV